MLVLKRKPGEKIVINLGMGRTITVAVFECRACSCKIGIDAPLDLSVLRGELIADRDPDKDVGGEG